MNVEEALRRVRFYTGTLSDLSGKAVNNLFTNQSLLDQLQTQLDQYANITKAIEDVYSFPLQRNTPFISAPKLALRSEAYRFINIIIQGRYFPADTTSFNKAYNNFPIRNVSGITSWLLPWGHGPQDLLYVFTLISTNPITTTLSADILPTDTTITVASTAGLITNEGRITIGQEKILYQYVDATHFYGCVRGLESTVAAKHSNGATVTENNIHLFYSRRHTSINTLLNGDSIPEAMRGFELEIPDEHCEGVIKAASYDLLLKVDIERAEAYKADYAALYDQYRLDIRKGRSRIKQGSNIRDPYMSESGQPFYTNLQF